MWCESRKTVSSKKCKMCKKEFITNHGRKYCSATCRTKFSSIPDYIERVEKQIKKKENKIKEWRKILQDAV